MNSSICEITQSWGYRCILFIYLYRKTIQGLNSFAATGGLLYLFLNIVIGLFQQRCTAHCIYLIVNNTRTYFQRAPSQSDCSSYWSFLWNWIVISIMDNLCRNSSKSFWSESRSGCSNVLSPEQFCIQERHGKREWVQNGTWEISRSLCF